MAQRTMSSEEYYELGRDFYKRKEYERAVDAFTNGLSMSALPSIALLDSRAASYDKINDYNSALKDGRTMIKAFKQDIKGYLRTASILEKMNEPDKALGIYKYGKKNVPTGDKNYVILQQFHDKLTRKLSPPLAADPFTIMPPELIDMVIDYLGFRTMVRCLQVSKGWNSYLCRRSSLWTQLDLSLARRDVSRVFVRNAVKHSKNGLTHAIFHRFYHEDMLCRIATACKQLTHVEFISGRSMSESLIEFARCATNLKTIILHFEITMDTATQILRRRPTLEKVAFLCLGAPRTLPTWDGPFPNLRELTLSHSRGEQYSLLGALDFGSLAPITPTLQSLTIVDSPTFTPLTPIFSVWQLTHLHLKNTKLTLFPRLPSTLTHLTLECIEDFTIGNSANNMVMDMALRNVRRARLPNLTHLTIAPLWKVYRDWFWLFLDQTGEGDGAEEQVVPILNCVPLQHFAIREGNLPSNQSLCGLDGLLTGSSRILTKSLRTLEISKWDITDDHVEGLCSFDPPLQVETVILSTTLITGASIKMLVDKLPLTTLVVNDCVRISDRAAIDYALRKGVNISWRSTTTLLKSCGKLVRY